jgi:hypothetical protein
MENIQATSFRDRFDGMPDVYNGVYQPYLTEFRPNAQITAEAVLHRTAARLPIDQVPSVFLYQDPHTTIRIVHHIHQVDTPFGQPPNPLTEMYLGFIGEVYQRSAQVVQLPPATFFATTGDIAVPTSATLTALLADATDGLVGPFNIGDPDTEVVNSRKVVPLPHAYVRFMTFRTLTPCEAWQQIGESIIQDGREADCRVVIDFLRAATVKVRGDPDEPPSTRQPNVLSPPMDGPILEHVHHMLHRLLPALFLHDPPADGVAQGGMHMKTKKPTLRQKFPNITSSLPYFFS